MTPFSVLDLSPIVEGASAADALRNSLELARHAESPGLSALLAGRASQHARHRQAATAVVIGHVAAGTRSIRVGSGGVMLPNHAPLVIAEQFGTLASLYPDRIDLGLGPRTGHRSAHGARAAARPGRQRRPFSAGRAGTAELFRGAAGPGDPGDSRRGTHGADLAAGLEPVQRAAGRGARIAVRVRGAFRARTAAAGADGVSRSGSRPRAALARPYAMVCVNVIAADTDAEARRLFTSHQQAFTQLRRGRPGQLPPPIDDIESFWSQRREAPCSSRRCAIPSSARSRGSRAGAARVPAAGAGRGADGQCARL